MTPTVQAMLAAAVGELGYTEEPFRPGETWHAAGTNRTKFAAEAGHTNGLAWCATFEVALAHRIGLVLPSGCDTASVWWNLNAWQQHGQSPEVPEPGDFVHFRIGDGHTGIFESAHAGWVTTIDGNTTPRDGTPFEETNGGMVCRKTRPASLVAGYGRPDYAPPSDSGDPLSMDPAKYPRTLCRILHVQRWGHEPTDPDLAFWAYLMGQAAGDDQKVDEIVASIYDRESK